MRLLPGRFEKQVVNCSYGILKVTAFINKNLKRYSIKKEVNETGQTF